MKAKPSRTLKPYNRRKKGRCMGTYIIKPRKHMTYRMIKRKHRPNRFFGWRIKQRRDYNVRNKMFKLYAYVTPAILNRSST
jgi:hypothetical protein